ncbi:MAG: ribonuclease P protein component [Candidatus Izimaplasma sp.]|nr:ribonuclease P protein component [Candidatus Izimaplasma bacterium]
MKKKYRIKSNSEIQSLMKKKQTVGNSYFVIYYSKNHENNNFRFAISVPKKYGNAVKRNLMKRRIREIIRMSEIKPEVDFFLIAKLKSKNLNFNDIKKNIENLFEKAKILKGGKI